MGERTSKLTHADFDEQSGMASGGEQVQPAGADRIDKRRMMWPFCRQWQRKPFCGQHGEGDTP
jgi:hypothetical protein